MLTTGECFQNGMVLQREKKGKIWGTAKPNTTVSISIQGINEESTADAEGKWEVVMPPLETSFHDRMVIKNDEEELIIEDIAVGEVWLAGGQSNMEFQMAFEKHYAAEVVSCDNENLRFYDVPEVCFEGQRECFDYSSMAIWRKADKENLKYFSAVGYYFQKELEKSINVPVGIIGCNWGGTPSCAWMKEETVRRVGGFWIERIEEMTSGLNMDVYWEKQKKNKLNDRGLGIEDAYAKFILPRTPSAQEIEKYFEGNEEEFQKMQTSFAYRSEQFPGCLYEHMLKMAAPYSIRGVLWYQGESDDIPGQQYLYRDMLTALIEDWRGLWSDAELPFLIVQLPGWESWSGDENHGYEIIRECQEKVTEKVPDTWLCSISDAGERFDIHPKDKFTVGHRLALLARGHVYRENILCDAPVLESVERYAETVWLKFAKAPDGLFMRGEKIEALEVSHNGIPIMFEAEIVKNSLKIVVNEKWKQESLSLDFARTKFFTVNIFNSMGIPVIPFKILV